MNARFLFEDVDLVCADCGDIFVWDGKAQQRCFEEQRQAPRRCLVCRDEQRRGFEFSDDLAMTRLREGA